MPRAPEPADKRSFIEKNAVLLNSLRSKLTDADKMQLNYDWPKWARPKQLPPEGDWDGWLMLGGRFGGKTRAGAEWVRAEVEAGRAKRIGLIGETSADGKDVMVTGDSGILNVCPPWNKPTFTSSSSKGRPKLTWPNGAIATLYDAREPDQLRGPQHDLVWMDELAKMRYAQDVFDQMLFGLRLGKKPRWLATTTPRPIKLLLNLVKDERVIVTHFTSHDNLMHLATSVKTNVIDRFFGTRLGRQEIEAEILEDVPGALWSRKNLDENRVQRMGDVPPLARVAVAVDPAVTSGDSSAETGIIVGGVSGVGHGYILEDATLKGSPDQWARRAVAMYRKFEADRIVAEANQGGEMVERCIRAVATDVPIRLVRATRGKYVRAEPTSALYEQNRISHVGALAYLEDQMIGFTPERAATRSADELLDRVDALVWLCADLFDSMTVPSRLDASEDYEYRKRQIEQARNQITGY